jgi:hypothetical protein
MENEYKLDENEEKLLQIKIEEYTHNITEDIANKIQENREKINNYNNNLLKNSENDEQILEELLKEKDRLMNITTTQIEVMSNEQAISYVRIQHFKKLQNNFVMEHTPLGNVLMVYDIERETFKYYSDNAIPYRFLEVVSRKYVKQFNCKHIFVDMEKELKIARENKLKEELKLKIKEEIKLKEENKLSQIPDKKNVFTKFKSYNISTGRVNASVPPKNSITNNVTISQDSKHNIILKNKSNRYTYEGKIVNFSFIKKIDRKLVDKKFALSFAEFKQKIKIN